MMEEHPIEESPVPEEMVNTTLQSYNQVKQDDTNALLLEQVITRISPVDPSVPPSSSKYVFLLEARGGTDKDPISGHRRDSIPIANAIAKQNQCYTAIVSYLEEHQDSDRDTNQTLRDYIQTHAQGIIVRNNPGTLSPHMQAKLDAFLTECHEKSGIHVLTPPHVIRSMGAKDALTKIKSLSCGMEDTEVYYSAEEFTQGFLKSMAFRPRVIKQNRGSQGEGIWICHLKNADYCESYGDRRVDLGDELVLMEANDNHVEHHTVGEFLEFCVK